MRKLGTYFISQSSNILTNNMSSATSFCFPLGFPQAQRNKPAPVAAARLALASSSVRQAWGVNAGSASTLKMASLAVKRSKRA